MSYIGQTLGQGKASRTLFTASGGETAVNVDGGYQIGQLDVFLNGVKLVDGEDYTASNGTSITGLSPALSSTDKVNFLALDTFSVSDSLPVSGGTFTGNVTVPTFSFVPGTAPSSPAEGQIYYNSVSKKLFIYDGTTFNEIHQRENNFYYNTTAEATADNLYAYWTCNDITTTAITAGTNTASTVTFIGTNYKAFDYFRTTDSSTKQKETQKTIEGRYSWGRGNSGYDAGFKLNNMPTGTNITFSFALNVRDLTVHSSGDAAGAWWYNTGGSNMALGTGDSPLAFKMNASNNVWAANSGSPNITGAIEIDVWYHFTYTFDGTRIKGYLNGYKIFDEPNASRVHGATWMLANYSTYGNNNNHFLRADYDEVTCWNKTFTDYEVAKLYKAYDEGGSLIKAVGLA